MARSALDFLDQTRGYFQTRPKRYAFIQACAPWFQTTVAGKVADIREWCRLLSLAAKAEIGYDGFARESFRKSHLPDLPSRFNVTIASAADYEAFVARVMAR